MSRSIQDLTLLHSRANTHGTFVASYRNHRSEGEEWTTLLSTLQAGDPKEENTMDSVEVSAMFAAYVWFIGRNGGGATAEEQAVSFARDNWQTFLPNAHKGLGRLLIRLAGVRSGRGRGGRATARTTAG